MHPSNGFNQVKIRLVDVILTLHVSSALLLVIAGIAKVFQPAPTAELLSLFGLPQLKAVVVGLGATEVAVGLLALVVGGPYFAAVVGVFYLGFCGVTAKAMLGGAASCGCFGQVNAPPSTVHLLGNASFAAVSFAAMWSRTPLELMADAQLSGIVFVCAAGAIAGLALVAFTALPEALTARRNSHSFDQFRVVIDNEV